MNREVLSLVSILIIISIIITVPSAYANPGQFILKQSSYTPEKVFPGDTDIKFTVTILNSGDYVRDVSVRLILPTGFSSTYAGSNSEGIGNVDEEESATVYFYIDIDQQVTPNYYELPLEVKFEDSGETLHVPIVVSEKAIFQAISIETNPQEIHVGDTGVIVRVTLKNTGQVTAESVQVQLVVGSAFSGSTIDSLGIMNPGETRLATFTIDVDKSASPGQYPTQLSISWTQQGADEVLTQNLSVAITVTQVPLYITILLVLAVIAVIIVAAKWLQKRGMLPLPKALAKYAGGSESQTYQPMRLHLERLTFLPEILF